jgi:hypothetical protein
MKANLLEATNRFEFNQYLQLGYRFQEVVAVSDFDFEQVVLILPLILFLVVVLILFLL